MKILIINNNAISTVSNIGKTISSFLSNSKSEDIACLYFGNNEIPDIKYKNYYRITEFDILKSILNFSFKTKNSHFQSIKNISINTSEKKKNNKFIRFLLKNKEILSLCRESLWMLRTWETKDLYNWIANFKPDVIFAVLGNTIFTHKIATHFSKKYNIPLNIYFTDDYFPENNKPGILGLNSRIKKNLLLSTYKKSLSISNKQFVIGEMMRKRYSSLFNKNFEVLINGIDVDKYKLFEPKKFDTQKDFYISYIGGLHYNRWKTILKLASITKKISDFNIHLRIFSITRPSEKIMDLFEKNDIKYCGSLSPDEVTIEMMNSHCLLHVESFEESAINYTKYSISTKIPECMASRRGLLAIGPSNIASIRLLLDNNIGLVLTENFNDIEYESKIKDFIKNYNNINFDYQFNFAKQHFNQNNMQLQNIL